MSNQHKLPGKFAFGGCLVGLYICKAFTDDRPSAGFYGTSKDIDLAESEKVLRAAIDSGMTLLNTADFYTGFGPDEEVSANLKLIGEAVFYLRCAQTYY